MRANHKDFITFQLLFIIELNIVFFILSSHDTNFKKNLLMRIFIIIMTCEEPSFASHKFD